MGRIRSLKPEFFRSRSLARCTRDARTTFQGLWSEADAAGRGVADARVLKGAIWPLDDDITHETVEEHLWELADEHITLYEVDGERYYAVRNWEKHQAASYRTGEAKHPDPADGTLCMATRATCTADHAVEEGKVREGRGSSADSPDIALSLVPDVVKPATPATKAGREPDALYDAVIDACGHRYEEMTAPDRRATGVAVATLRGVSATPDEVAIRAAVYRRKFPQAALTPSALAKHWAGLRSEQPLGAPRLSKSMQAVEAVGQRLGIIDGGAR